MELCSIVGHACVCACVRGQAGVCGHVRQCDGGTLRKKKLKHSEDSYRHINRTCVGLKRNLAEREMRIFLRRTRPTMTMHALIRHTKKKNKIIEVWGLTHEPRLVPSLSHSVTRVTRHRVTSAVPRVPDPPVPCRRPIPIVGRVAWRNNVGKRLVDTARRRTVLFRQDLLT